MRMTYLLPNLHETTIPKCRNEGSVERSDWRRCAFIFPYLSTVSIIAERDPWDIRDHCALVLVSSNIEIVGLSSFMLSKSASHHSLVINPAKSCRSVIFFDSVSLIATDLCYETHVEPVRTAWHAYHQNTTPILCHFRMLQSSVVLLRLQHTGSAASLILSNSKLPSPLSGCSLVSSPVGLVDVGDLWYQRVVWVGVCEHRANGEED